MVEKKSKSERTQVTPTTGKKFKSGVVKRKGRRPASAAPDGRPNVNTGARPVVGKSNLNAERDGHFRPTKGKDLQCHLVDGKGRRIAIDRDRVRCIRSDD